MAETKGTERTNHNTRQRDPVPETSTRGGIGGPMLQRKLSRRLQRRGEGRGTAVGAEQVHQTAERGLDGPVQALPHADAIQRSFGRHDVSGVQAHVGGSAATASREIGAAAYAVGNSVAFASTPDLHTAAHEAAHVVQQRSGVSLLGGVGEVGDPHEQHADAVAERVVAGRSAEDLLDKYTGGGGGRAVQRYAFVNDRQLHRNEPNLTSEMDAMVTDNEIRSYNGMDEFKRHASKQTDYLGNLPSGTWLRFEPAGLNVLGEDHTKVSLDQVCPAVRSTNFVDERFAMDDLSADPEMKAAYEKENADRFKKMGIDQQADKSQFGAESLYPKLGFGMETTKPFLDGSRPINALKSPGNPGSDGYTGKPVQRYIKIAWGFSKDNKAKVDAMKQKNQPVPFQLNRLATVHQILGGQLDPFITALPVDGFLGDALAKPGMMQQHLQSLLTFAGAVSEVMLEMASADPSSGLTAQRKTDLQTPGADQTQKRAAFFGDWRDKKFEVAVRAAAGRNVRYAGMGLNHLTRLKQVGLPANAHAFDMVGADITRFEAETQKLKGKATHIAPATPTVYDKTQFLAAITTNDPANAILLCSFSPVTALTDALGAAQYIKFFAVVKGLKPYPSAIRTQLRTIYQALTAIPDKMNLIEAQFNITVGWRPIAELDARYAAEAAKP